MRRLLFPTDFSETANKAFDMALRMTVQMDGEINVLHSLNTAAQYVSMSLSSTGDPTVPGMEPEIIMQSMEEQKKRATQEMAKLEMLAEELGISIKTEISAGDFQEDVIEYAEKWETDIIVMGTKGASGLQEALIGSNAQHVVRNAKIPVLTIHDPIENFRVNRMVYAGDFLEDEVNDRIPTIKTMAESLGAELHTVLVNTPAYFEESGPALDRMKEVCAKYGLENAVQSVYNDFNIDEGVLHYSNRVEADLIVLVTHGFKGLKKLLSDNVTESVVNHSTIPVLSLHVKS
jgi:nucleotide-binding universal stress UspA family protein